MKPYLIDFFHTQAYQASDAACFLAAYDGIMARDDARVLWEEAISLYDADVNCDYGDIIAKADKAALLCGFHEYTAELLIFACLSRKLREHYLERGYDLAIFERSMADLRYKVEECKAVYGIVGSFVAGWFPGFFNLTRFGLGRLQFEIIPLGCDYSKNGHTLTADTPVLNIHIPRSGEPLTEEACEDAYARAKAFFGDRLGDPCPFVCNSWLLFPRHEDFLPKHTNTYRFFKSFDIINQGMDKSRGNLWRLFDTMEKHPDRLPADTTLRRAYVSYLQAGGQMGYGRGLLFR
ncbi:MAG: hypothetical protein E7610_00480 [Ruminococcaceae bacterium]|nr:hypothetical protein [Oscillospiraceae bacterium]